MLRCSTLERMGDTGVAEALTDEDSVVYALHLRIVWCPASPVQHTSCRRMCENAWRCDIRLQGTVETVLFDLFFVLGPLIWTLTHTLHVAVARCCLRSHVHAGHPEA